MLYIDDIICITPIILTCGILVINLLYLCKNTNTNTNTKTKLIYTRYNTYGEIMV